MKHIFKKLHHNPNRSNETPQQPSPPQSQSSACSDSPRPFSYSPAAAAAAAAASPATAHTNSNSDFTALHLHLSQDYYASEEEYQVQLALALSVSSSGQDLPTIDPDNTGIRTGDNPNAAANFLSRRYWNFGVLDFDERVLDGFYDVYSVSTDPATRGDMPSLTELESDNGGSGYEVVIVNKKIDPALDELMQIARCILLDCPTPEITLLVQRLAELVTEHLGGPVCDANIVLAKWMERSMELRTSLHTIVLPIGSLRVGLSRHRALLFKTLADSIGIPCRLVRGSHYTGVEDDAVSIIKLQNESEFFIDLMGAPGTLIPADVPNGKATPKLNSSDSSKFPSLQTTMDAKVSSAQGEHNSVGHNLSLGAIPSKSEAPHLLFDASADGGVGTSGLNNQVSANLMDNCMPQVMASPLYKGVHGSNLAGDSVRANLNVLPYSPESCEDSKNLFAELNPFLVKGPGKSRPLAPLMWKNRHTRNDIPNDNEFDNGKGLFQNIKQGANTSNPLSVIGGTSRVPSKESKLSEKALNNPQVEGLNSLSSNESKYVFGETGPSQLSFTQDVSSNFKETYHEKDNDSVKIAATNSEGPKNNMVRLLKDKRNTRDRFSAANMELTGTKAACCSSHFSTSYGDTDIDDVGECEIAWEDLILGERIGLGSYGEVYHADWNGTEVAVKKFLDQDFSGAALDEFKREVRIMRRLRHPNVVLFMGAVTRPPNLSIITEFLPHGSLYRIIHRPHCQIDEKRRIRMALDVANGMNCLHTSIPTIVHRDLKSPNLLVDDNWNVKVCDFGLSRLKHNTFLSSKSTAGTPEWMAPEVLRNEPSNEKCDVYSFGVILWELATLKLPWSGMNPMQVVGAVGFQNRRPDIPKEVDPLVARIIRECWQTDSNLRPSFAQLSVALKPLQRLAIPTHVEQQTSSLPQEISLNATP